MNETIKRIEDVIKAHYEETDGTLAALHTTHIAGGDYVVQLVAVFDRTVHVETVRVDDGIALTFTLLSDHDLVRL